jgi:hypothetical protein
MGVFFIAGPTGNESISRGRKIFEITIDVNNWLKKDTANSLSVMLDFCSIT